MSLRALAIVCVLSAAAVGCAGASQDDSRQRMQNPNLPREGIGGGGDMGPPARDMPGKGRGTEGPHGKP